MKKIIFLTSLFAMLICFSTCTKEGNILSETKIKKDVTSPLNEIVSPTNISQLPLEIQTMINESMAKINENPNVATQVAMRTTSDQQDVTSLPAPGDVEGHCTFKRKKKGAHINWHSTGLTSGDAVTLWIIVAKWKEDCSEAFFVDLIAGGGKVINGGGIFNLNTFLANGDNSNSVLPEFGAPPGPGMDNAYTTILHLVSRTHGPNISGSNQLTTFGDCNVVCTDLQESISFVDCP